MLPLGATLKLRLGVINTANLRLTVAPGIGGEVFQQPPGTFNSLKEGLKVQAKCIANAILNSLITALDK